MSSLSPSAQDILTILGNAESLFWDDLTRVSRQGSASRVRDAAVSLAVIRALQSSLGKPGKTGPVLTATLLGACAGMKCFAQTIKRSSQMYLLQSLCEESFLKPYKGNSRMRQDLTIYSGR